MVRLVVARGSAGNAGVCLFWRWLLAWCLILGLLLWLLLFSKLRIFSSSAAIGLYLLLFIVYFSLRTLTETLFLLIGLRWLRLLNQASFLLLLPILCLFFLLLLLICISVALNVFR